MSKEKLYNSSRWHNDTSGEPIECTEQSKEERIKSAKMLLKILVDKKELTQEEADERLKKKMKDFN